MLRSEHQDDAWRYYTRMRKLIDERPTRVLFARYMVQTVNQDDGLHTRLRPVRRQFCQRFRDAFTKAIDIHVAIALTAYARYQRSKGDVQIMEKRCSLSPRVDRAALSYTLARDGRFSLISEGNITNFAFDQGARLPSAIGISVPQTYRNRAVILESVTGRYHWTEAASALVMLRGTEILYTHGLAAEKVNNKFF